MNIKNITVLIIVILLSYTILLFNISKKPKSITELYNDRVYQDINELRRLEGLNRLKVSKKLEKSGQLKAQQIERTCIWSHSIEYKNDWVDLIKKTGYKEGSKGEVLARGFNEAMGVVEGWKDSPTHYDIISGDYKDYGVYTWISKCDNKVYVVGHFGK